MSRIIIEIEKDELHQLINDAVKCAIAEMGTSGQNSLSDGLLLDIEGALEVLKPMNMKRATLYQKTHRREIPHMKKGKFLYFDKNELIAWMRLGKKMTKDEENLP